MKPMITKTLQYISIGLCLLLSVTGCSDVVSKHIVGNEPSVLHPEEWDGIWISEENALIARVRDPEQGISGIWAERTELLTIARHPQGQNGLEPF